VKYSGVVFVWTGLLSVDQIIHGFEWSHIMNGFEWGSAYVGRTKTITALTFEWNQRIDGFGCTTTVGVCGVVK
jgi:hypothetical protein